MSQQLVKEWARELMERKDWVVVDTETSGFGLQDEILQVVVVNAWGKIVFSSLVKPTREIDEDGDAFKVNRISNVMVAHAPAFKEIYPILRGYIENHLPIAYNSDFDSRMVFQDIQRHGLRALGVNWQCAMRQYALFVGEPGKFGQPRPHKLQKACTDLNLRERAWHDAGADAVATYDLIVALAEMPEGLF